MEYRTNGGRSADCESCKVRAGAICGVLAAEPLQRLGMIGHHRKLERGQTLIWEGDDSFLVANVIEGVLKLSTSTGDGREQIVGIVYPADFIGRPFGKRSNHSVTALTDAEVCLFTRSDFDTFAREHPELEHELLKRTLHELDRARSFMLLLGRKSADEKVATLLLELAARMGGKGAASYELPFGRQQMADVLGLTIETVSRQMTRLKSARIIDLPDRRGVVINDRDALQAIAEAA